MMRQTVKTSIRAAVRRAAKYLRDDAARRYALLELAIVRVDGPGAGCYSYSDPILVIVPDGPDAVMLYAHPFHAGTGEWNGASIVPDSDQGEAYDDGRTEASLFHDLIYSRLSSISEANATDAAAVRRWADGILIAVWTEYARRKGRDTRAARIKRRVVWRTLRSPFYWVWRRLSVVLLAVAIGGAIAGCSSCSAPPPWTATIISPVVYSNAVPGSAFSR